MELGLTFPLQRFLRRKPPDYGTQPDRRFCWDLHSIHLRGHSCLLAVHCHSRYTFVRYDVAPLQWADLPGLFRDGLLDSLTAARLFPGPDRGLSAAGRRHCAYPHPRPPGGGLPQPGMGGCAGAGPVPGSLQPGAAPAGPRRQHPPQPLRGL